MEISLIVRADYLCVLGLFAAKKDVRFYLNGINLEIGPKFSVLMSSDGHRAGCFRVIVEQPDVTEPLRDIILPSALLWHVKPKPKGEVVIVVGEPIVPTSNARPVRITYAGVTVTGETIDATYPDIRRVIPSKVSGKPAQFNVNYLADLAKASAMLGRRNFPVARIDYNGQDTALFDLGEPEFLGAICPIRDTTTADVAPAWIFDDTLGTADLV